MAAQPALRWHMRLTLRRRLRAALAFGDAALRYWVTVFPLVGRETERWRRRADAIPDPVLRGIALETLRRERGNAEGAAAFAAFAPLRRRAAVVRAAVAFQTAYDYVDSLAEQPSDAPAADARALHEALRVALCPDAAHPAYYRHHRRSDDGGYLRELVDACRAALAALPSRRAIEAPLLRATARMIDYQTLVHGCDPSTRALAAWARGHAPRDAELGWWEVAAGGASSLGVFALVSAAARRGLTSADARSLEDAYFPWAGALHVLLDSLVDQPADAQAGHHSLVANYRSAEEAALRLDAIAATAFARAGALRHGRQHALVLAGMVGFYLSLPAARLSHAAPARRRVLAATGALARPASAVLRARRAIGAATAGPLRGRVP
jgi:tetraprenyl-beta-curcumene synthase